MTVALTRHEQLRQMCWEFHLEHPEVWERFQQLTLQIIARGFESYGSKTIWEVLRWEADVGDENPDRFKLNNNFTAFYARAFNLKYPEYGDFFRLRVQISQHKAPITGPELKPQDFQSDHVSA